MVCLFWRSTYPHYRPHIRKLKNEKWRILTKHLYTNRTYNRTNISSPICIDHPGNRPSQYKVQFFKMLKDIKWENGTTSVLVPVNDDKFN